MLSYMLKTIIHIECNDVILVIQRHKIQINFSSLIQLEWKVHYNKNNRAYVNVAKFDCTLKTHITLSYAHKFILTAIHG